MNVKTALEGATISVFFLSIAATAMGASAEQSSVVQATVKEAFAATSQKVFVVSQPQGGGPGKCEIAPVVGEDGVFKISGDCNVKCVGAINGSNLDEGCMVRGAGPGPNGRRNDGQCDIDNASFSSTVKGYCPDHPVFCTVTTTGQTCVRHLIK